MEAKYSLELTMNQLTFLQGQLEFLDEMYTAAYDREDPDTANYVQDAEQLTPIIEQVRFTTLKTPINVQEAK